MNRPLLIRATVWGFAAMMVAGLLAVTSAHETSAGWPAQQTGKAKLTAGAAGSAVVECDAISNGLLGGPAVQISWAPIVALPGATVSYRVRAMSLDGSNPTVLSESQPGATIDISKGLLENLIEGLLGGSKKFKVHVQTIQSFSGPPGNAWYSSEDNAQFAVVAPTYLLIPALATGYECG